MIREKTRELLVIPLFLTPLRKLLIDSVCMFLNLFKQSKIGGFTVQVKKQINAMSDAELDKLLQGLSDVLSGLGIGEGEAFQFLSKIESIGIKTYQKRKSKNGDVSEDYREVHPGGKLARGVRNGAFFNEVLDMDSNVTYSIHYNPDNGIAIMRLTESVFVSVDTEANDGHGKIINSRNKQAFYDDILAQHEDYQGVDVDEAIIDYAQREIDCPRW
ncbi:MAG: hypothetical protein OXI43_10150 [Candidatus Poribacteria bacterium]|nr:hypothetical protein [Candidatus Poribacteria bacterium]